MCDKCDWKGPVTYCPNRIARFEISPADKHAVITEIIWTKE